ncbi:hypothetical protein OIO90_006183 [Microbotryomycetes sp. JL221]|nr:hypothetical protein OIO90_006183 [Microbotryomycetes sp. JL221]
MESHLTTTCQAMQTLNHYDTTSNVTTFSTNQSKQRTNQQNILDLKRKGQICANKQCQTKLIVSPIKCLKCGFQYCAKHRFDKDHDCQNQKLWLSSTKTDESDKSRTTTTKSNSGGLLSKFAATSLTTKSRTDNSASTTKSGLAALRRAQAAVSNGSKRFDSTRSTASDDTRTQRNNVVLSGFARDTVLGSSSPSSKATKEGKVTETRQEPIVSSSHDDSQTRNSTSSQQQSQQQPQQQPSLTTKTTSTMTTKLGLGSKTDKRRLAEQTSAMKSLQIRANKGLLNESEKLKFAEMKAMEAKKIDDKSQNCILS